MTWTLSAPIRRLLALGILAILLFGTGTFGIWPICQFALNQQQQIQDLSYQRQHLAEIQTRRPELEQANAALRAQVSARAAYWSGPSPALIAANIQNLVRQSIALNGGQTKSTSMLGEGGEGGLRKVSVRFQFEGAIETVQRTLEAIEVARPALFVDSLMVNAPAWQTEHDKKPVLAVDVSITGYIQVPPV
jgi:cell division protein FtsB